MSKIFQLKGITKDSCVLNYCGGGIAASLEAFVLYQLGFENITIYDNSLHEWAATNQTLQWRIIKFLNFLIFKAIF